MPLPRSVVTEDAPGMRPRLAPRARLQWPKPAPGGGRLWLGDGRCVLLNELAVRILSLCDGRHRADDIAAMAGHGGGGSAPVAADIHSFLAAAGDRGWLHALH